MSITIETIKEKIIENLEMCKTNHEYFLKIYDMGFITLLSENRVIMGLVNELGMKKFSEYYLEPLASYLKDKLDVYKVKVLCSDFRKPKLLLVFDTESKHSLEIDIFNNTLKTDMLIGFKMYINSYLEQKCARDSVITTLSQEIEKYTLAIETSKKEDLFVRLLIKAKKKESYLMERRRRIQDMVDIHKHKIVELDKTIEDMNKDYDILADKLEGIVSYFSSYGYMIEYVDKL